jgi:hypothetical protein
VNLPIVECIGGRVMILIPADQGDRWGTSDQVGLAESIGLGQYGSLTLLIKKDFACLDRSEVDNQDTFANPNAGKQC